MADKNIAGGSLSTDLVALHPKHLSNSDVFLWDTHTSKKNSPASWTPSTITGIASVKVVCFPS
jgi:hypothetical protein